MQMYPRAKAMAETALREAYEEGRQIGHAQGVESERRRARVEARIMVTAHFVGGPKSGQTMQTKDQRVAVAYPVIWKEIYTEDFSTLTDSTFKTGEYARASAITGRAFGNNDYIYLWQGWS